MMRTEERSRLLRRWLRFNFVGIIGIALQMATLAALAGMGFPYLLATAAAVEAAVVHNFIWHERYTWWDRRADGGLERLWCLLKFNAANGAVSLLGNLLLMHLLVGRLRLPLMLANAMAIAACSAVNFGLGEGLVFQRPTRPQRASPSR